MSHEALKLLVTHHGLQRLSAASTLPSHVKFRGLDVLKWVAVLKYPAESE